jgi:TonB family protein
MKKILPFSLALVGLVATAMASSVNPFDRSERESLKIEQTTTPIFPQSLTEIGVRNGSVRVVISVDAEGKLAEWLVIGYTHVELRDPVVNAIRKWRFEPMRVRGEPRSATVELVVNFEVGKVVVTMDVSSYVASRIESIFGRERYWPCTLKELDRIPTPIKVVSPVYPVELRDKGIIGEAVVEFYIDETGAVRMPALLSADHEELGFRAAEAVREWSFEPPTRNGKPVLVRARQLFRFGK